MSEQEIDLSVFDDRDEREPTGECRRCGRSLYHEIKAPPDDDLCFGCWIAYDKAEAEYIAVFTHGGTRHE